MTVLKTQNLSKRFGGLKAVSDVSIHVHEGELLGLIGPNGAGKTTIFNLLTGVYVPTEGSIKLADEGGILFEIGGLKPHIVAKSGVSRTFQNIRLFKDISVLDNLLISMHKNIKHSMFEALFRLPRYQKDESDFLKQAMLLLELVGLGGKSKSLARNLPYGEQRKLEIARAMATDARLIFLDEPAAGMNPSETEDLAQLIRKLQKDYNLTIVLIEHDMKFVMNLCERVYVLDFGSIIAEGTPEEIRQNKRVITAYLGEEPEQTKLHQ
ncbi:MAG: ABC transporter ATP-binding protein [Anaerovoracaceae bacterium]|jgi:branched-chain amino acid transport system ATP-binding protein